MSFSGAGEGAGTIEVATGTAALTSGCAAAGGSCASATPAIENVKIRPLAMEAS